jgi:O-antigen/teichoic acid export membrane protein
LARRSLLFNASVYIVGQFATKALGFILLVVYARFLEPEDFGITGTLAAYGQVLATIFVLGLHGAVTRHYFEYKDDPARLKSYLTSVYTFQIVFSASVLIAFELFGDALWYRFTSGQIGFTYVRLMLWATFLTGVLQLPQAVYQAQERATLLVGWQFAQGMLAIGFGVLFVAILEERALGVLRSQVASTAVLSAFLIVLFARELGSRAIAWKHVKTALLFALPLLPHSLGSILMQTVDRIMLEKYTSQADVGLYSIAMLLAMLLSMVAAGVNQAWAPYLFRTASEDPPEEARKKAETFAALLVALFSGLGLVGALLGHELLHVLGPKYLPVLPYLIPFVIGNLISIYYFLPANQLLLAQKTKWFLIATGIATLISIGLNVWLLPRGGGGMVAAWIFVTGTTIQTGIIVFAARLHARSLLGMRHGLAIVITIGALGIATYGPPLLVRLALLAGGLAVLYFLLARGRLREVFPKRG